METEKFIRLHEAQQKGGSFVRSFSQPSPTQSPQMNESQNLQTTQSSSDIPLPNQPTSTDSTPSLTTNQQDTLLNGTEKEPVFPEVLPTIRHDIKALSPYDLMGTPLFIYLFI